MDKFSQFADRKRCVTEEGGSGRDKIRLQVTEVRQKNAGREEQRKGGGGGGGGQNAGFPAHNVVLQGSLALTAFSSCSARVRQFDFASYQCLNDIIILHGYSY